MNIIKFYSDLGDNFDKVVNRLGTKEFVEDFIVEFVKDDTFSNLCNSYNNKDIDNSFLASHTLKGIASNLGLSNLYKVASTLTEALRKKTFDNSINLFNEVVFEYNKIIDTYKKNGGK